MICRSHGKLKPVKIRDNHRMQPSTEVTVTLNIQHELSHLLMLLPNKYNHFTYYYSIGSRREYPMNVETSTIILAGAPLPVACQSWILWTRRIVGVDERET